MLAGAHFLGALLLHFYVDKHIFKHAKEHRFFEKRREFRDKTEENALIITRQKQTKKLAKAKSDLAEGICKGAKLFREMMDSKDMMYVLIADHEGGPKEYKVRNPDIKAVLNLAIFGEKIADLYSKLCPEKRETEERSGVIILPTREDDL